MVLFERDLERLIEFYHIDEYLDRLDDDLRRARKRALVFLDYRQRSPKPLNDLIGLSIKRLLESDSTE